MVSPLALTKLEDAPPTKAAIWGDSSCRAAAGEAESAALLEMWREAQASTEEATALDPEAGATLDKLDDLWEQMQSESEV